MDRKKRNSFPFIKLRKISRARSCSPTGRNRLSPDKIITTSLSANTSPVMTRRDILMPEKDDKHLKDAIVSFTLPVISVTLSENRQPENWIKFDESDVDLDDEIAD